MSSDQQAAALIFAAQPRLVDEPYPPGVLAILTGSLTRFKTFMVSWRQLKLPTGSGELVVSDGEKVASRNIAVDALLANPACDWLYFMDDDHKFSADQLLQQLEIFYREELDVLGTLYVYRAPPFDPIGGIVVREGDARHYRPLSWNDLPSFGRLLERRDLAMGTAGLLIHRRAFAALERPYFQVGQLAVDREHEDLYFCVRCQEAGLRCAMDLGALGGNVGLGHTTTVTVWPQRDKRGQWGVGFDFDQLHVAPREKPSLIAIPGAA